MGHKSNKCISKKACGEQGCTLQHHKSLHSAHLEGLAFHVESVNSVDPCILLLMRIHPTKEKALNVMWDSASTISLITFKKAKELSLVGCTVDLTITTAGGNSKKFKSCKYDLTLIDSAGQKVIIAVYGLPQITSNINPLQTNAVLGLLDSQHVIDNRPTGGEVDVLIGLDHALFHPQIIQNNGHLVLYENRFGKCVGGTHPHIQKETEKVVSQVNVNDIQSNKMIKFFESEALGVECNPKCGSCRCGTCPIGGKE